MRFALVGVWSSPYLTPGMGPSQVRGASRLRLKLSVTTSATIASGLARKCSFEIQRSSAAAIQKPTVCELPSAKRHPHQRRIPRRWRVQAEEPLQAVSHRLGKAPGFTAFHEQVYAEIGKIKGIGGFTVYDVSHRIGAYMRETSQRVYLHAGTKLGARALNV